MATKPDHENDVRSYPDDPRPGTTGSITDGAHQSRANTKETPRIPMRIARIDTIMMTAEERDNAAEALAVLYQHYQRDHPDIAA